jgi:hypothetical protein
LGTQEEIENKKEERKHKNFIFTIHASINGNEMDMLVVEEC